METILFISASLAAFPNYFIIIAKNNGKGFSKYWISLMKICSLMSIFTLTVAALKYFNVI